MSATLPGDSLLDPSTRTAPLLFDAMPGLAGRIPWRSLAHTPTPVEPCDAIAGWLGRGDVWMKRDDRISPVYGGNKVRRYEFVLADAAAKGATCLVTVGGIASTQVMATALLGASEGFTVRAVLFDQPVTRFAQRALLVDATAGAELIHGGGYATAAWRAVQAWRQARDPYLILPGAAGPLANLGYLDAMIELDGQVRGGLCPRPDVIVLPTGSSGTLAALALGASWLGWPTEVVGVRITSRLACNRLCIDQIAAATARYVRRRAPSVRLGATRYRLLHDAIGPGYGHPTREAIEALPQVEALLGVPGEVTYTAKALVGLRALCADPRYRGKNVLLWNTLSSTQPPADPTAAGRLPPGLRRLLDAPVVA